MGLAVVVVLLLFLMPVLLYLLGWGIARFTRNPPSWLGFPARPKPPTVKPSEGPPARYKP